MDSGGHFKDLDESLQLTDANLIFEKKKKKKKNTIRPTNGLISGINFFVKFHSPLLQKVLLYVLKNMKVILYALSIY